MQPRSLNGPELIDALPEAFLDALGDAVREVRQQGERELERISAEARATIAELNAKVVELAGVVRSLADEQVGRVSATLSSVKDGAPGRDGRDAEPVDMAHIERLIEAKVDERVEVKAAAIPVPKDGHSPTQDELLSVIEPVVQRMVAEIPVPQNGRDGVDGQSGKDAEPISKDQIVEAVLSCGEAIREAVAKHLTDNPPPGGIDGKDGIPGDPGRDGRDADPVDYESVQKFIVDRIAEFPVPRDGLDGVNGKDGVGVAGGLIDKSGSLVLTLSDGTVRDLGCVVGKDAGPGPAGKDADPITKEQIVAAVLQCGDALHEAVAKHLTDNPPPSGRDGNDGSPGAPGQAGKDAEPITKDQIVEAVLECEEAIQKATAEHLTANPPPAGRDGLDGAPGDDGRDGRDAEAITKEQIVEAVLECGEAVQEAVIKHLTDNPPPSGRDGRDGDPGTAGKDAEPIDYDGIHKFVTERISEIPVPKDGKDGVGLAGAFINRSGSLVVTLSSGSVQELGPVEGKSVDYTEIKEMVRSELRGLETKAPDVSESAFPSHLLGMIEGAHRALSEPLIVRSEEPDSRPPFTLNVAGAAPPAPRPMRKTISTRRNENGDLIADVVESEI